MVRGWVHEPQSGAGVQRAIALTHGAGSNCDAPLLKMLAMAFADSGMLVLRFDLPYRQSRPHGPPFPAQAARDREGIQRAVEALREVLGSEVYLGGHSYGGRQSTMAAAEHPGLSRALLLLSYPLHAPNKPDKARTEHFSKLNTPALFVHGTRDPFGSVAEIEQSLKLIPAHTELEVIAGAPHGVPVSAVQKIMDRFLHFCETVP